MEIKQLQYFLVLSEQEHISRSAELLGISQPALSRSITRLEQELGLKLFEHHGNRVCLSEYGRDFADYARRSLEMIQQGIDYSKRNRYNFRGCLRIVSRAVNLNLTPCLCAYMELNPDVQIHVSTERAGERPLTEEVDFLLTADLEMNVLTFGGEERWTAKAFIEEEMVLLMSKRFRDYPADVTELNLADLKDAPFVGTSNKGGHFPDITAQKCLSAGFSPRYSCYLDNFDTKMQFVGEGRGIIVVPEGSAALAQRISPDIRAYHMKGDRVKRHLYLVRNMQAKDSELSEDFWQFFLNYYGLEG